MISAAGFSLISRGREVSVAASSVWSLICESILVGGRNGEYYEGRGEKIGERGLTRRIGSCSRWYQARFGSQQEQIWSSWDD